MTNRLIATSAVILTVSVMLSAASADAWCLYRLRPAEVVASSTAPGTSLVALSDGDAMSAWRPAADDGAPWVEFRFTHAVRPAYYVVEGERAAGIGRVREVTLTMDGGTTHVLSMSEFAETPAMSGPAVDAVRSLRIAFTRCDGGAVGVGDLAVVGRRPDDPSALTLAGLARCTLVLDRDLSLPAGSPSTTPVTAEVFYARDGLFPWSLQMRARDVSASDRTVRASKSFAVTNVTSTPSALMLQCADGSVFGLFDESNGTPRSIMSITEQFTVAELNDIFAGVIRFTDAQGRTTEDY